MKRPAGGRGFTLTELVISLTLSSFILVGIVGVASQMVRFQMEGKTKGDVTGWTLISLNKMNKELEDATVLDYPTTTGDYISGCSNYTRITPGKIDASLATTAFWYCVSGNQLMRYQSVGACPMAAPTCGVGAYEVYARDFYKIGGMAYFFRRANEVSGVELNYIVGIATSNADTTGQRTMPVYLKVQTKIGMNKAYNNAVD